MPLIEVIQSRFVTATIRLESVTATLIDQYAAFVHGSADDVVDKALNYVFAKDREFQEFPKSSQSAKVVPSLRVRRGASGDVAEPAANGKAPVIGAEIRRESAPNASLVPGGSRSVLRTG